MTTPTIINNFTQFIANETFTYGANPNIPKECWIKEGGKYSAECIHQMICPQFNNYFINVGLIILISYAVVWWLKWAFFKHWYKYLRYDETNSFSHYIGDLSDLQNRVYWDTWITTRVIRVMAGFIGAVVYLSWSR